MGKSARVVRLLVLAAAAAAGGGEAAAQMDWMQRLFQQPPAARPQAAPMPAVKDPAKRDLLDRRVTEDPVMRAELLKARDAVRRGDEPAMRQTAQTIVRLLRTTRDGLVWTDADQWESARLVAAGVLHAMPPEIVGDAVRTQWGLWAEELAEAKAGAGDVYRAAAAVPLFAEDRDPLRSRLLRSALAARLDAGDAAAVTLQLRGLRRAVFGGRLPERLAAYLAAAEAVVARSAVGDPPELDPLPLAVWSRPATDNPAVRSALDWMRRSFADRRVAIATAWRPAVVGDRLVRRTLAGVECLDLRTGGVLWSLSLPDSVESAVANEARLVENSSRRAVEQPILNVTGEPGATRLAHVAALGGPGAQVTTAGDLAFVVVDVEQTGQNLLENRNVRLRRQSRGQAGRLKDNVLLALDAATGRTVWEAGGEDNNDVFDRPAAGGYFLGPPAEYRGSLLALAERNSEVALMSLDPRTGLVRWSLPLATTDSPIELENDRRFHSATPTLDGGVAYCETTVGWCVAVDVADRRILWASRTSKEAQPFNRRQVPPLGNVQGVWRPRRPVVAGDRLWVFPQERPGAGMTRDKPVAVCLDRWTGETLYEVPREDGAAAADVTRDTLILTTSRGLKAYAGGAEPRSGTQDGELVWTVEADGGRTVAGQPVRSGGRLIVPLTGPSWIEVNVESGAVVRDVACDAEVPLGTLTAWGGTLVSTGPLGATRFGAAGESVPDGRPHAELRFALAAGELDRAAGLFADAEAGADDEALFEGGVRLARRMAAKGRKVPDAVMTRLTGLASAPGQKARLVQLRTESAIARGEYRTAFERLLRDGPGVLESDAAFNLGEATVSGEVWLTRVFSVCWDAMTPAEQDAVRPAVRKAESLALVLTPTGETTGRVTASVRSRLESARRAAAEPGEGLTPQLQAAAEAAHVARLLARSAGGEGVDDARRLLVSIDERLYGSVDDAVQDWSGGECEVSVVRTDGSEQSWFSPSVVDQEAWSEARRFLFEYDGGLRAVTVTHPTSGKLEAVVPVGRAGDSGSLPRLTLLGPDLVITTSDRVHVASYPTWRTRWSRTVDAGPQQYGYRPPFAVGRPASPKDLRGRPRPANGIVEGRTAAGLIVRERGRIRCLDMRDGSVRWTRPIPANAGAATVLPEAVIVTGGDSWTWIDPRTGLAARQPIVQPAYTVLTARAGHLVSVNPEGMTGVVRLEAWAYPPAEGEAGWSPDPDAVVPSEARWTLELESDERIELFGDGTALAVTGAGGLSLLNLDAGTRTPIGKASKFGRLKSDETAAQPELQRLVTWRDGDDLFVFTNRLSDRSRRINNVGYSEPVNGAVACVDLAAKTLVWEADIPHRVFVPGVSRNGPVLLLSGRRTERTENFRLDALYLTGVDRRTGRTLFDREQFFSNVSPQNVQFRPALRSIDARVNGFALRATHRPGGE